VARQMQWSLGKIAPAICICVCIQCICLWVCTREILWHSTSRCIISKSRTVFSKYHELAMADCIMPMGVYVLNARAVARQALIEKRPAFFNIYIEK